MRFWMAVLETIAKKCFATKLAMTKVWFPLQPLKNKKKKKRSRLPIITPAAHNESQSPGTHALPSKYPIYLQRIQAVQPHTSCLLRHCRRLSFHPLLSPNVFFPHFPSSLSSMNQESLTQSQNSPWTPELKFMVFPARIIKFYPSLSTSASTPEWYKPNISKMWGRNGTFHSALRVSHDAWNGWFMEGDELEPNPILPSPHFPITRWRDASHDLKNPVRNSHLLLWAVLLPWGLNHNTSSLSLPESWLVLPYRCIFKSTHVNLQNSNCIFSWTGIFIPKALGLYQWLIWVSDF